MKVFHKTRVLRFNGFRSTFTMYIPRCHTRSKWPDMMLTPQWSKVTCRKCLAKRGKL